MGSTAEADRKRRQVSSISPTAATAKNHALTPLSEDKKLDTAVLQFQNQKLVQKLETQKAECVALENKSIQLREKQQLYDNTLALVNQSWEELVDNLESCSMCTKGSLSKEEHDRFHVMTEGVSSSSPDDAFLARLLETGATQTSCAGNFSNQTKEESRANSEKTNKILHNIVTAIDRLWNLKDDLYAAVLKAFPESASCRAKQVVNLMAELKNLRLAIGNLHIKHKSLAREMQSHQDADAKNKAGLKRLREELEIAVAELEESNCKLASLKAERDATKGTLFPVLNVVGSKHAAEDSTRDKQKDLQDMESALKELVDQASSRLSELKCVHEERIYILKKLSHSQNTLKSLKCISSSQAFVAVREQLSKAKADLAHYQALFEKLQVEKDNLAWREKEMIMKSDIVDVLRQSSAVANSRVNELEIDIQKQINYRNSIEAKLEEASREPGRNEIIAQFKALVSSFPDDMGSMQSQLSKYKEAASDIHSLRADVQTLSSVLDQKAKELEALFARSTDQVAEMQKLQAVVHDLRESDLELKLILEMYRCESTDSRDVMEARESEYRAWAHVQSLKSSLDERNLELRVKTAIEAEAVSQQKLAAAEAEIANLRQKLDASKREKTRLSDLLKAKHEENEAYLSEIETIGHVYDDMQTQNQHLLQQITERDDYNIKLVLEGIRARQLRDSLIMEKEAMERAIHQGNASVNFFDMKATRIEDQLKNCSEQVQRLAEDRLKSSITLENTQKKLLDVRTSSEQLRESLEESQSKVEKSRNYLSDLHIELEKERFDKRRIEEELEILKRKASCLRSHIEGSSVVEKLQLELKEYREILKCSICLDRRKEVVIAKCNHLFCNPCIQKVIETRHRRCPVCSASFGTNDVKPVYI